MSEQPEKEEIDISSGESTIVVNDPDEYAKAEKVKQIYKIKQEVVTKIQESEKLKKEYNDYWHQTDGSEIFARQLASQVALYGSELLPLLERGIQNGILDEDDMVVVVENTTPQITEDIREYVRLDGMSLEGEKPSPKGVLRTKAVYRHLDSLMSKLGLGVQFEEEKGPAEI